MSWLSHSCVELEEPDQAPVRPRVTLHSPAAIEGQRRVKELQRQEGWLLRGYFFCTDCARVTVQLADGGCCFCGGAQVERIEAVKELEEER